MGNLEKTEIVEEALDDNVDIRSGSDYNKDIDERYKRQKEFIITYHRLSPYQLNQFNRRYGDQYGKLEKEISERELYHYAIMADDNLVLENMLEYIKTL